MKSTHRSSRTFVLTLVALCLSSILHAADSLPGRTLASGTGWMSPGGYWARGEVVPVEGQDFDQAWRVRTVQKPGNYWAVQLNGDLDASIQKDDVVALSFHTRSLAGDVALARVKILGNALSTRVEVGPDWMHFVYATRASKDFAPGKSKIEFFLGDQSQTIEIGGLEVVNAGKNASLESLSKLPPPPPSPMDLPEGTEASDFREQVMKGKLADFSPTEPVLGETEEDVIAALSNSKQTTQMRVVPVEGRPYPLAVEIVVPNKPKKSWLAQMSAKTSGPVKKGDALLAIFDARCVRTPDATSNGKIEVNFSMAGAPYSKSFRMPLEIQPGWERYFIRGMAKQDFAPGEAKLEFFLGDRAQTLQFGGLTLLNFGQGVDVVDLPTIDLGMDYAGRDQDAQWRKDAAARIEKIRMGDLTIEVVDSRGKPVPDAEVDVDMTAHSFWWGTTIDLRPLRGKDGQQAERGLENLLTESDMFNLVVPGNELKWQALLGSFGPYYNMKQAERSIEWAYSRGLDVKGHVLVWKIPEKILRQSDNDPQKVNEQIHERITDLTTRFKDEIVIWDVINENYIHRDNTELLGDEEVANWFEWAREGAGPNVPLLWNEIHVLPDTERGRKARAHSIKRVNELKEQGAPISAFGIQGHLGVGLAPAPEEVLQRLDELHAAMDLPIHFTEFDVNIRDIGDPDQVAFQADYVRDFLTVAFSHPAVECLIYWTPFPYRWLPDAALTNRDWSLRPHGKEFKKLVTEEWWTDETVTTGPDGKASLRGFLGDYEITVRRGEDGQTATTTTTLTRDGETIRIQLEE